MSTSIDTRDLRNALGVFATGVTVVTTRDAQGQPRGFTANSFTSVSLDPPLVLVCVGRAIGTASVFASTGRFAVNILAADQQEVSAAFGSPAGRRFDAVDHADGPLGSPILDGAAAWLECETHETVEEGDHFLLVGRVVDYAYTTATPLGYCRGAYVTFGLAQEALNAVQEPGPVRVGAIIEHHGEVYLEPAGEARMTLPIAPRLGSAGEESTLLGRLHASALRVELSFIYAVFEAEAGNAHYIFYRAQATAPGPALASRFFPLAAIPWDALPDDAIRSMLRRYVAERQQNVFGVYVGDHRSGTVRSVSG